MKRTFLIGTSFAVMAAILTACGGGGGDSGGSGGGGGTATSVAASYRVVAIPALSGNTNSAAKVNSAGQVVGTYGPAGAERAFYWDSSNGAISMHNSGNPADSTSFGLGINSRGEVSGVVNLPSSDQSRGFYALQSGGGFIDPGADKKYSSANAINSNRLIAGTNGSSFDQRYPVLFNANSQSVEPIIIGGSGSRTGECMDVNESSDIVGWVNDAGRDVGFFRQSGGTAQMIVSPNAGESLRLNALNDARNACGRRGQQAAYMAAGSPPTVIGGLTGSTFSEAFDISTGNIVVGYSNNGTLDRAFAWTQAQGMINLQTRLDSSGSGWTLQRANGISSDGRICGVGTLNGATRAFMLVPN